MPTFYEFFAGGGMARAGLGPGWTCLFANDNDPMKAAAYAANWGVEHLKVADVATLTTSDLPGHPDLVWGSFPCQDLSLAGNGAGLNGKRSGTFWPFWNLVTQMIAEGRAPRLVVLENVRGALTSHGGRDIAAIRAAMEQAGYEHETLILDAIHFLPHSRPRLFVVGCRVGFSLRPASAGPCAGLAKASRRLKPTLQDLLEPKSSWKPASETRRLLAMMSERNRAKLRHAMQSGERIFGTAYRRTRNGVQRLEARFDGVAGCLRTPAGGSSRQIVLEVEGKSVRSRLLSAREAARLMGLPDSYKLPQNYNAAYHVAGDGVVVPVVRHLAEFLLEPLLK